MHKKALEKNLQGSNILTYKTNPSTYVRRGQSY